MIKGLCQFCKTVFRKREQKYKFCSISCANRFNLNNSNRIELPKNSKKLAEFIGICLGDGYTSTYQTGVTLNKTADNQYVPYVINLVKSLFPGASISLSLKKTEDIVLIRINSKIVSDFLKGMGIIPNAKVVPQWIYQRPSYIKCCIRGLFDTEGSISFKVYKGSTKTGLYKQLNFRNIDEQLIRFIRDNLLLLGFKPTRTLKHSLYLSNHKSITLFEKQIGFSNPKLKERSNILTIEDYQKWKEKSSN